MVGPVPDSRFGPAWQHNSQSVEIGSMKNRLDGGEAVLEALRMLNVAYIVSSPGSEWSPIWEALSRQKQDGLAGPKFVQCWHETLAVNVATGYTMITGQMQAVILHAAAGTLQGSLGLYGAMRAEIPMVVLSGESSTLGEDAAFPMEPQWYAGVSVGGSNNLVAPLVKWAGRVSSPVMLYPNVVRAGEIATRTPQGPVHLDIPMEYLLQDWVQNAAATPVPAAPKKVPTADAISQLARDLVQARDPVIFVEHACLDAGCFDALVALAELLAFPVVGSPGASCANFPYDHPLWLGVGSFQHLEKADLVFLIGGRTPWYPPSRRRTSGRIVALNEHPFKDWLIHQNLQADSYLEGDVTATLGLLIDEIKRIGVDPSVIDERRRKWRDAHDKQRSGILHQQATARRADVLSVPAICEIMARVMSPDAIYVEETITHAIPLRHHLPLNRSQSFFRHNGGGLGQVLGIALGIKLAAPERPVVVFAGDGSMLYNPIVQAFGLSKQYDLPLLIVVLNNSSYASMRRGHELFYPDGAASRQGHDFGVKIDAPPFDALGVPFGFFGASVKTPDEFENALRGALKALDEGRTAIIDAVVPEQD
jgi:acetolactate synthase-1/2/3 large subunit